MNGHRVPGAVSPEVVVREFLLSSEGRGGSGLEMAMYLESELDLTLTDSDIERLESILANAGDGAAPREAADDDAAVASILALVSGAGGGVTPGSGGSEPDGHG